MSGSPVGIFLIAKAVVGAMCGFPAGRRKMVASAGIGVITSHSASTAAVGRSGVRGDPAIPG
jgi:hypothetical protein